MRVDPLEAAGRSTTRAGTLAAVAAVGAEVHTMTERAAAQAADADPFGPGLSEGHAPWILAALASRPRDATERDGRRA